jgi:hypothetical protein
MLEHEPGREIGARPSEQEGQGRTLLRMGRRVRKGAIERLELGKVGQVGKVVPQQGGL